MKNRSIVHDVLKIEAREMKKLDQVITSCSEKLHSCRKELAVRLEKAGEDLERKVEQEINRFRMQCETELEQLKQQNRTESDVSKTGTDQDEMIARIIDRVYSV